MNFKKPFPVAAGITRRQFYEYAVKCLLGVSVVFPLYGVFPGWRVNIGWVMTSLLLSITYDNDSKAATSRMEGNIVGSFVGLGCWYIKCGLVKAAGLNLEHSVALFISIVAGIGIVLGVCLWFRIISVVRTALVAFFIVTLYDDNYTSSQGAFHRVGSVVVGCLLGLLINRVFTWVGNLKRPPIRKG